MEKYRLGKQGRYYTYMSSRYDDSGIVYSIYRVNCHTGEREVIYRGEVEPKIIS